MAVVRTGPFCGNGDESMNRLADQKLFNGAAKRFSELSGMFVKLKKLSNIGVLSGGGSVFAGELERGGVVAEATIMIFADLTANNLGIAERMFNLQSGNRLVVSRYIPDELAEILRGKKINFLDTTGNAYLDMGSVFVFIKGNKPERKMVGKATAHRLFRPGGLKVIFALLCLPGLEKAPLREIARKAGVVLGTVSTVVNDLKALGYMQVLGKKGRFLKDKERLLNKWVEEYLIQLAPRQRYGFFKATDEAWLEKLELSRYQATWGGETAAALLTGYLQAQVTTIYVKGEPAKLIMGNRLRKDPEGNIEIREAFWDFASDDERLVGLPGDLVHPILIYADLLATGDSRNIETAQIIYEQTILGLIR